jgi:GTP-binding protein
MKIKSAEFDVSAPDLATCPKSELPEFPFIGRSNVGKSSLINLLCERKDLAKVSATPGKTKLINFFRINGNWSLVDLPGYGYAHVGKQQRAEFNEAVADYLQNRKNIICVFVLIDSRLEPQRIDLEFINWLGSCELPFAIIFTKTDKHSAAQLKSRIDLFNQTVFADWEESPPQFATSSKTKDGRTDILNFIAATVAGKNRT